MSACGFIFVRLIPLIGGSLWWVVLISVSVISLLAGSFLGGVLFLYM